MSRLSQVLLFDSDSRGRDTLIYGLEGESVSTQRPTDAAEALALAQGVARPDVLVVVLRGTEDQGWFLLRQVSTVEDLRGMPRLVLAAAAELPGELRQLPGDTHFLPLPAYVRDVITACKLLAAGTSGAGAAANGQEPHLAGTLSDYGLLFLVRTMVGLGRSGTILVERASRKGELRFNDGKLVSAEVGSLQGLPALHQLLLWEEAALEVRFRAVASRDHNFPQGDELLDDTERFLRDFAHATKNIGHPQSLFIQDAVKIASLVDAIAAEVLPVMKLFDGQRNLGDVLEDSPFRVFDTLKIVSRLVEMGIVRRKAIEKPTTGLAGQGRRPAAAAPVAPTASAPAVMVNGTPAAGHRRRSRRRTGEVPIQPEAAAAPAAAPSLAEPPVAEKLSPKSSEISAHGELRAELRGELRSDGDRPLPTSADTMPKVLIDLGPVIDEGPVPELMTTSAAVAPAEIPPPGVVETAPAPAAVIDPVAPPMDATTPAEDTAGVPDQRLAGIRSAEIDTGSGAVPAPELLATPGSGPSIMLDPNLVAEMDAFELANTAATPPPTVTAAPPAKPAAAPAASAVPGAVVSFVKGGGHPAPVGAPVGGPTLNNAPTVPISPVAAHGAHPAAASKPAPAGRTPPPRSPTPVPGDPVAGRRASGEFNALEADFFARESDLYQQEPTESFEDLDPNTREPRRRS
jgi:CheY-like chemotaxis protein